MNRVEHRYLAMAPLLSGLRLEPFCPASWPGDALDVLAAERIAQLLAEQGIVAALLRRGFAKIELRQQYEQASSPHPGHAPFLQQLTVQAPEGLLVELALGLEQVWIETTSSDSPREGTVAERCWRVLAVDALRLQDPRQAHGAELGPGQAHPGLRLSMAFHALFCRLATALGADGILVVPEFFHTAVWFSLAYRYVDPTMQGLLCAAQRDLVAAPSELRACSWAFERGEVTRGGAVFRWPTEAQVHPLAPALRELLDDPERGAWEERAFAEARFVRASRCA